MRCDGKKKFWDSKINLGWKGLTEMS